SENERMRNWSEDCQTRLRNLLQEQIAESDPTAERNRRTVSRLVGRRPGCGPHSNGRCSRYQSAQRTEGPSGDPGPFHTSIDVSSSDTDRKSTRLNSSHVKISYAVFCLKKKKTKTT